MSLKQPTPHEPPELWRWDGEKKGWTRIDEPSLSWEEWTPWTTVEEGSPTRRPLQQSIPKGPGVYEIRRTDAPHPDERLYIGYAGEWNEEKKTGGLSTRLHDGLMRDTGSTHKKALILNAVNGRKELLQIRWAPCQSEKDAYFCEQYLCSRYLLRFGRLPDYVEKIG